MKTALYPQLLGVLGISAAILIMHARGFAETTHVTTATPALQQPTIVALAPIRQVQPRRDPFTVSVDEGSREKTPVQSVGTTEVAQVPEQTHSDDDGKGKASSGLHLRAVVLGSRRYALMADGAVTHIVTVGSPLAGSAVRSIALDGIVLTNGARFLPEESGNSK